MKILWTDGSADPNPGKGGFSVIEINGEDAKPVVLGRDEKTTNIRMEGSAMIAAIKYAGDEGCEIHSDSEFWINVLTKWAPNWQRNEWHKSSDAKRDQNGNFIGWKDSTIKNLDLVKELYELYTSHNVKLTWVRGHVGVKYNEIADEWAKNARNGATIS